MSRSITYETGPYDHPDKGHMERVHWLVVDGKPVIRRGARVVYTTEARAREAVERMQVAARAPRPARRLQTPPMPAARVPLHIADVRPCFTEALQLVLDHGGSPPSSAFRGRLALLCLREPADMNGPERHALDVLGQHLATAMRKLSPEVRPQLLRLVQQTLTPQPPEAA